MTKSELFSGKLFLPGRDVRWRNTLNEEEVEALLRIDLFGPEDTVREKAPTLTQTQFDALISFTFNVGQRAFSDSTLLKKLQAGRGEGAAAEFPRWKYAGGKVLRGLERRRTAEKGDVSGVRLSLQNADKNIYPHKLALCIFRGQWPWS